MHKKNWAIIYPMKKQGNVLFFGLSLLGVALLVVLLTTRFSLGPEGFTMKKGDMKKEHMRVLPSRRREMLREGVDEVLAGPSDGQAVAGQMAAEVPEQGMAPTPYDDYDMLGPWNTQFSNDLRNQETGVVSGIVPAGPAFSGYSADLEREVPDPYINNQNINEFVEARARKELTLDATKLLPQETNDEWYQNDFGQARFRIGGNNLINTDQYNVGVDTQGSSLKIANYDLRPRPPNPKLIISPWNNSSVEPDLNNKGGFDYM